MPPGVARGVQRRVEPAAGQHGRRQEQLPLTVEQVSELHFQLACSTQGCTSALLPSSPLL